jgi:hypothetical protein
MLESNLATSLILSSAVSTTLANSGNRKTVFDHVESNRNFVIIIHLPKSLVRTRNMRIVGLLFPKFMRFFVTTRASKDNESGVQDTTGFEFKI